MGVAKHTEVLLSNVVQLNGGRDVQDAPLLVVQPPNVICESLPPESHVDGTSSPLTYSQLVSVFGYLSSLPVVESSPKGVTVVLDARSASPKTLRTVLRALQQGVYKRVRHCVIVQPDKFLHQQKLHVELLKEALSFKTTCVSLHKLSKFTHISTLPQTLGGTNTYDAREFIAHRERVENVRTELERSLNELRHEGATTLSDAHDKLIKNGEQLVRQLNSTPHHNEEAHIINKIIQDTKDYMNEPHRKKEVEEQEEKIRLVEGHSAQVNALLDWIEGGGEKWLLTLREIGESSDEARQLIKQYSFLTNKAQEVSAQCKELSESSKRLASALPNHAPQLNNSRDEVELLVDNFTGRVERGKELVEKSEEWHSILEQFTRRADLLLESLCSADVNVQDAGKEKSELEESTVQLKAAYEAVSTKGSQLLKDLASQEMTVGRHPRRDYSASVAHVARLLEEASERKRRCLHLVNVRLLKVEQMAQLVTCEEDIQQTLQWMHTIQNSLHEEYYLTDTSPEEIARLRAELSKLEETARSTYEYGKQLCQVALVLRRSLRMQHDGMMGEKLHHKCNLLCRALNQIGGTLTLATNFNRTAQHVEKELDELEPRLLNVGDRPARHVYMHAERARLRDDIQALHSMHQLLAPAINANTTRPQEHRDATISKVWERVERLTQRLTAIEDHLNNGQP